MSDTFRKLSGRFLNRVFYSVALLTAVLCMNFVLLHLAPGDVSATIAQSMGGTSEEIIAQIRAEYGLDRPIYEQLLTYLYKVAQFDLGYSFFYRTPVTELILERLPATLLLVVSAQFLALTAGVWLGVIAARKPNGVSGHIVTLLALLGFSSPVFWTGLMLLIGFSLMIPLFPTAGLVDVTVSGGWFRKTLDVLHHLALPCVTLASVFLALYARMCRASMLEALDSDYVRTARAKGLRERHVIYKHALKNALGPVVSLVGVQFSAALSGAILVETVFNWPGLGTLVFEAIIARDTPTILGVLFFSCLVVLVGNTLTDITLKDLDPRIQ